MSDSLSAIDDDIEEYKHLCKVFNEKVQYKHNGNAQCISVPDCYGKHADKLQERYDREIRNRKK